MVTIPTEILTRHNKEVLSVLLSVIGALIKRHNMVQQISSVALCVVDDLPMTDGREKDTG